MTAAPSARQQLAGEDFYLAARRAVEAGQPEEALRWLDQAKAAFAEEGSHLASLRTDLGRINVLDDLARTSESIAVAESLRDRLGEIDTSALTEDDRLLHTWLSAAAAENLGATLGIAGRHAQAVDAHERAKALYTRAGSEVDLARTSANLGVDLVEVGDPRAGLETLETARPFFAAAGDQDLIDRCLMYESRALALMGQYGTALDRLEMAQSPTPDTGDSVGPDTLRSELTRASVYEALNLFPETLELCAKLAPEFQRRSMNRDLATCRRIEARALLGQRRTGDAVIIARDCVILFDDADLPVHAAHARITLAECLGPGDGCIEIDRALPVLDDAGESRGVAEAALVGADLAPDHVDRRRYLDTAVRAGALDANETRWRTLWHQSLEAASPSESVAMLDDALGTLAAIHANLGSDQLRAPFMANRRDPLESRVGAHLDAGETEEAFALSASYRARALLGVGQEAAATVTTAQTTLLYQSIGDRLLCFICRPSVFEPEPTIEMVDLGEVVPEVRALTVKLEAEWRHLSDPRLRVHIAALRDATEDVLRRLHLAIFADVDARLDPGPITIVPTGCLAAIPFAALHDGTSYLVDRRAIAMAPGVPQLERVDALPQPGRRTLVVGLPDHLAPMISIEATQVAELTGGALLLDGAARSEAVQAALPDADIVHLATHSLFRSDNPWLSWIRLADRDVTADEFATWDLTGKTIVLAACSSGRQSSLGEDEMLGLPRAAFLAGAAAVIVNQWAVDDIASVGLMSQLHAGLAHLSPAQALQQAQIACRNLHPHPYFWAGAMVSINPLPPA